MTKTFCCTRCGTVWKIEWLDEPWRYGNHTCPFCFRQSVQTVDSKKKSVYPILIEASTCV